jgi:hypothetical protein
MSTGKNMRHLGVDGDDRVAAQAVTDVVEAEGDGGGSPGRSVASTGSAGPIVLPPSTSQDALVDAVQRASALGVPLLLEPGTHFTKPGSGRNQRIAIGPNGLQIRLAAPPAGTPRGTVPAVIKRPDFSISLQAPDDSPGLFFIPAPPTPAELAGITTWRPYGAGTNDPFEFAIVIRGQIAITGVSVDCNMHRQKIETLPMDAAAHSTMLGFAGQGYPAPPSSTGKKRIVYVGFQSVTLNDVHTVNGGYADDVWFSRGYFNPNIERVDIERFRSTNRVNPRRASISFSGLCQNVRITDADLYSLHLAELSSNYNDLPRQNDVFQPSAWHLESIKANHIELAAKGKVYVLDASDLITSDSFGVYQAGGVIRNSTLRRGPEGRLFRLDDLVFDKVRWILDPDDAGRVSGLRPSAQYGDPCVVTFRENTFSVTGNPTAGEIITSEYSKAEPKNHVTVTVNGCTYPDAFGRSAELPIARVLERGVWTFALRDFGDRDPAKAILKSSQPDIVLHPVPGEVTDKVTKVTIYEHANYQGNSQDLTTGRYDNDLGQLSIGNDTLSSLKVRPGFAVRLYEHWHFQGRYIDVTMDTPAVPMFWNDRTSSLIVYPVVDKPPVIDVVEIYEHGDYGGGRQTLQAGRYDSANGTLTLNKSISSALIPPSLILRLHENPGFTGASVDLDGDVEAFGPDWNDRASSVEIFHAPPGSFLENEVKVLQDYVSDGHVLFAGILHGLAVAKISVEGEIHDPNADLVQQILSAREQLFQFLVHPSCDAALDPLRDIGTLFLNRDFEHALVKRKELAGLALAPGLLNFDFNVAFRTTPVEFTEWVPIPRPDEPDEVAPRPRTLPGYHLGPVPTEEQRNQILAFNIFLSQAAERRFRLGLLLGEAYAGLRRFREAQQVYSLLLGSPDGRTPSELKFLAIRAGMAHLASGDSRFHSSRNLSAVTQIFAREDYENAISVVEENRVSPLNPVHAQIVDYARNRLAMLGAGINFLGLRDSFVPVFRHEFLLQRTTEHIARAQDAVQKFVTYQTKFDDLNAAEQQTTFELGVAQAGVDTAVDRQGIVTKQIDRTQIQIDEISSHQGPFAWDNVSKVFDLAAKAVSTGSIVGAIGVGGVGLVSMALDYESRQQQLDFQKRLAQVDQTIANLQAGIAASEVDIANKRVQFLQAKRAFGGGRLDKDLYHALAQVYEQLAERQVEAAIWYAYIYERAVAFFLAKPGISHIQLDYRSSNRALNADGELIAAADLLNEDVSKVTDELVGIDSTDVRTPFTEPPFSLAREFPLEFSRFVQTPPGQTARMNFLISFHQLSKRRPDCYHVRIINKVVVRIPSIAASANFAGTLTHWGRFLSRDRQSTLDASTVRLIPTPAQVDDALREQQQAGTAQVAIGGVIPYALDKKDVPFGVPSEVTSQFTKYALDAFEGYGPAGLWQLELRNVNVRNIADITLTFDLEAAADVVGLEAKVEQLIGSYEQELADQVVDGETLDRMKVFSLRRQFRDAFDALRTGTGTFQLTPQHLDDQDFDGTNAKIRTVIAQALDPNGVGVAGVKLEIAKPGTNFLIARQTSADGLSVDFSQGRPPIEPPANRPAGPGTWQVRLPDPTQFNTLGDLVLFFVSDFR